jgi:hypothetical protein
MKRSNVILWIVLVALTLLTFYSSEDLFTGTKLVLVLMGIVIIKFLGIGFQYVDLKDAAPVWKVLFTGFILVFAVLVVVIT